MRCAIVLAVAVFLAGAACGGDEKSGAGDADRDEAFVKAFCRDYSRFTKDVEKAMDGPTPTGLGDAFEMVFKALAAPTERFAKDFAKLEPPPDLTEWHKDASKQLSAAAKALKAGNFGDDALDSLSDSPVPDMPARAHARLSAIAAETAACDKSNPFDLMADGGGGPSTGGTGGRGSKAPSKALQDAASGTWTGRFGNLVFNTDGTATFDIRMCGTDASSRLPFQVPDDCSSQSFSGALEVEAHSYILRQKGGVGSVFGAYVDKDGRLHVSLGDVSAFGPGQKGTVDLFAQASVVVDGARCTQSGKAVKCSWTKEQGEDVLELDTGSGGGASKVIILPVEGLAVEPSVYVSVFQKK